MQTVDHLTSDELADVLKGARLGSAQAYHIQRCGECRRNMAASLLALRLGKAPEGPSQGPHLDPAMIERLHSEAYEFEDLGREGLAGYLAGLRHLAHCDGCFARFFALHQELTPSERAMRGAVSRFELGQRFRRVGTLRVTRTLDRVLQVFLPATSGSLALGPSQDRSLSSALARIERGEISIGAREEIAEFRSASFPPSASMAAPEAMSDFAPVSRILSSAESPAEARMDLDDDSRDPREALGSLIRQLKDLLQQESAEVSRLAIILGRFAWQADEMAPLAAVLREYRKVSALLDAHDAVGRRLRSAGARLESEFALMEELERRRRETTIAAEPGRVELPGLLLEFTTSWRGDSGQIAVRAWEPTGVSPRAGVQITSHSADEESSSPSTVTDEQGEAVVPLSFGTTGIRVFGDPQGKPSFIRIEVLERSSLR